MNPYQRYKNESVENMSSGELLVMLYDGAIKDLKKAQIALDEEDYKFYDDRLDHLNAIIRYLMQTLDVTQPISRDLMRLYSYITFDIGRCKAGRRRRKDELQGMIDILQPLRDGFEEASRKVVDNHIPFDRSRSV